MNGTVIRLFPNGIAVQMDSPGKPTGTFNILDQTTQRVIGQVILLRQGARWSRFNWTPKIFPLPVARVGDFLRPAS